MLHEKKYTKPAECAKLELSNFHWKIIEDLMPVLGQLFEVSEILASEKYPSVSCVLPLLNMVQNDILNSEGDTLFTGTTRK